MIQSQKRNALKLTALAIAAAAIVAPVAWSGSRVPIVNKASTTTRAAVQEEQFNRFIVTYRSNARTAATTRQATFANASTTLGYNVRAARVLSTGAQLIRTDTKLDLAASKQLMIEIMKDPNVLAVEPDVRMKRLFVPNDPLYAQQWHYKNGAGGINAEPAWDITKGAGTVVAVLDTGITPHTEFAGQLVPGYDFIADIATAADGDGRDADPNDPGDYDYYYDSSWHGTHVAGTIAAKTDNAVGTAGVAPDAKILPVRVLGVGGGYTSDILDAITWSSGGTVAGVPANANPAEVINLSLGGGGACSTAWQTAIDAAVARGTTIVVAAGNSGGDAASLTPASCNNVIAVSAVGPTGTKASYSSFGPVVDVAAPGGSGFNPAADNILSTYNLGLTTQGAEGYAWNAGTSMAAPHVAGIVALIQSASATPKTPAQVKKILENTAYANGGFPGGCSYAVPCGTGIVDAHAAVLVANGTNPLPADPPAAPPPPPAIELQNGVTVTGITVAANGIISYELHVPNGATNLLFAMYGGTGDADIYVKRGSKPTSTSYDCRPFSFGNNETCFFPAPASGVWYVDVKGFSAATGVSLYPSFVDANYPYKQAATVEQLANHKTKVTLTWQHGKKQVDIYRNGLIYNSRRNNYTFTDNFRIVGTGTMTYKICNQGTAECSNDVTVSYTSAK